MSSLVYMQDLQRFGEVLDQTAAKAEDVTTRIIHMMAEEIQAEAYKNAPKATGELANSIVIRYGHREAQVVATAPHAAYVEFGTWSHNIINPKQGTYTIRPKKPGGVLRFTGKDGKTVYTKKVEHPGIKPQPFLGPAHAAVMERHVGTLANAAVLMLVSE
jgi:hypothetical protein